MSTSSNQRRFSADEAGELIERAAQLSHQEDDGLTYEQLVEVAGEVGIYPESVAAAVRQAQDEQSSTPGSGEVEAAWRPIADRCLEILCLKPVTRARK